MTRINRFMPSTITAVGEDEVAVVISTNNRARDDHIFEPGGAQIENYLKNPVVLWNHDTDHPPLGNGEELTVTADNITARVRFAPKGICSHVDEKAGLIKAGVIRGVSVGIDPIDTIPIDPKNPRGGQRVLKWELIEFSFCNIPVDTGATVTARTHNPKEPTGMSYVHSALKAKHTRALERAPPVPIFKRGLYEVSQLAYMLQSLGYCHDAAEYEAALEGDDSPVPAMLGEALSKFGQALIAMTAEEVGELLADVSGGDADDGAEIETRDLSDTARAFISAAANERIRAWRRGIAIARAGKTLSEPNAKKLAEAQGHSERAMKHHKALGDQTKGVGEQVGAAKGLHAKASQASSTAAEALQTASDQPSESDTNLKRCARALRSMNDYMVDLGDSLDQADDLNQDVGDSHNSLGRSIKSVQRCVRAVVDGSTPGEDSDSKDVQKSAGDAEDSGSARSRAAQFERRQAELRELAALVH